MSAILELRGARAEAASPALDLSLGAGEAALVLADDAARLVALADIATGLARPAEGAALFLGRDWASLPADAADVLRGRIGRSFFHGGWLPHLSVAENVLLPSLFRAGADRAALTEAAAVLARGFGLPGLPLGAPRDAAEEELARAALVRAFLGRPALLVLENPRPPSRGEDLLAPLLEAIAALPGSACLWLTTNRDAWRQRAAIASQRFRLTGRGFVALDARRGAA